MDTIRPVFDPAAVNSIDPQSVRNSAEETVVMEPVGHEPFAEIEFQVAEALADIEEARRYGRPSPLEAWTLRYPQAAEHIREAAASSSLVDSAIDNAGLRMISATDEDDLEIPDLELEDFEITRVMTSGAMGVVYEAVQKSTRRKVALKTLPAGLLSNVRRRRLFEREVEAVATLHHPNIVPIFWSGLSKGQYYFAMQYIEGRHLDDYVRSVEAKMREMAAYGRRVERIPVPDILRIMAKVCDAVQYAHLKGVIHRDLKPSNILVDKHGEPHLLDFGLAKTLSLDTQEAIESAFSLGGQVFGTLPYLAPEQARGNTGEIDVRTDVYALGVVLYKLLTERYPYSVKGSLRDVLDNIQNADPKPPARALMERGIEPSHARRIINDELRTILMTALAKKKESRYQSAAALGRDLRLLLAGQPIEAKRHARWWYIFRKFTYRNSFQITMVSLVLILGVALGWRLRLERIDASSTSHPDEALRAQVQGWQRKQKAIEDERQKLVNDRLAVARVGILTQIRMGFIHWQHGESAAVERDLKVLRDEYAEILHVREGAPGFEPLFTDSLDEFGKNLTDPSIRSSFENYKRWCLRVLTIADKSVE